MEFCFSFRVQPNNAYAEYIVYNFRKAKKFSHADIIECAQSARQRFFEKTKEYPFSLNYSLSGETAGFSIEDNNTFLDYFFHKKPVYVSYSFFELWS